MPTLQDASATADRRRILNRLRRLGGQVRGLSTMVADEKSCDEVLTQVMAAKSALDRVAIHAIAYTVKCGGPTDTSEEVVDESLRLFLAYARPAQVSHPEMPAAAAGVERRQTTQLLSDLSARISTLEDLVESDAVCDDVLGVVIEARDLLDQVGLNVVAHSMRSCLAPRPDAARDEVVDEALAVFLRYIGTAR